MTIADYRAKAAELIPGIVASKDEKLAEFKRAHVADCAAYTFRCERHGHFLALFITRGPHCPKQTHKAVSCIRLADTPYFHLEAGREADMAGTVHFSYSGDGVEPYYENGRYPRRQMISYPTEHLPFLQQHAVSTGWVTSTLQASVLRSGHIAPGSIHPVESMPALLDLWVKDGPRGHVDDTIQWGGSAATLHIPFGLGQTIYDKILAALD